MLRVHRQKNGSLVVSVPQLDAFVLRELPARLRNLLERPDFASRVVQRLFPAAYKDPSKDAEYQKLLGDDLLRRKRESIALFEKTLENWKLRGRRVEITISEADFELWLGFVNDMRLVLGTELDIQDESWGQNFDPDHPQAQDFALLHYLSWLEEELLQAKGFPDSQTLNER